MGKQLYRFSRVSAITCVSHKIATVAVDLATLPVFRSLGFLDVLSITTARPCQDDGISTTLLRSPVRNAGKLVVTG
jgi:hypothetical protein